MGESLVAYTVCAYLSHEDLAADRPALTEIFRTEPGERYSASVRAEARRRTLARQAGRNGHPAYTNLTCTYTPNPSL